MMVEIYGMKIQTNKINYFILKIFYIMIDVYLLIKHFFCKYF